MNFVDGLGNLVYGFGKAARAWTSRHAAHGGLLVAGGLGLVIYTFQIQGVV